jgi:hypothetical protein
VCVSSCCENSKELTCFVKDKELNDQLIASQEGLFSMILVIVHCNGFNSYNVENVQRSYSIISFDESVYYSLT